MRGKLEPAFRARDRERIIPAHAGQTCSVEACLVLPPDHPRACGANTSGPETFVHRVGSSPRMRGKLLVTNRGVRPAGIIPAHAGQTCCTCGGMDANADHPRACGANGPTMTDDGSGYGSSPRMRGKQTNNCLRYYPPRIIPAHAGQTASKKSFHRRRPDHPRACGANQYDHFYETPRHGSSPRMRGKQPIIAHWAARRADHPRACGANLVPH